MPADEGSHPPLIFLIHSPTAPSRTTAIIFEETPPRRGSGDQQ
jgi:hypothetical protein